MLFLMSQTTLEVVLSTRIYLYVASLEATPLEFIIGDHSPHHAIPEKKNRKPPTLENQEKIAGVLIEDM